MKSVQIASLTVMILILCSTMGTSYAEVSWSPIGPGGGGWLSAITVVDDDLNTVYVGCDVGGIYKSTNHGATWEIKDDGLDIYYVQDIAYDHQIKTTLYAATRSGVYKSTNGGDSWVPKRNGFPAIEEFVFSAPISDILVDPNDGNKVYAGVGLHRAGYILDSYHWQTSKTKGTIFKSTDAGESWTLIRHTGIDSLAMVHSLDMDPGNSDILYAATSNGVYKSVDAGENWVPRNSGFPHLRTMTVAVDPQDSQTIYTTLWAEPGSAVWEGGIYRSTNGGESWTARNNGLPQQIDPEVGLTCNFPTVLVHPDSSGILYAGNRPWAPDPGVFKSTDGGGLWTRVTRSEGPDQNLDLGWITEHGIFVRCLALDPLNPSRIFFGTSTGLFRTTNAGADWDQAYTQPMGNGYWQSNGLETSVVADITIDPVNSNLIYAGYWDMGFLKSEDGGISFKRTTENMLYDSNTFCIVVDPISRNRIYAATGWWEENEGTVNLSTDYGETWTPLTNRLPNAQVWSLALDESSPPEARIVYATSYEHGIFKSADGGQSWDSINTGLGIDGNLQMRKIAIDPNNSLVLFAGIEALHDESQDETQTTLGGLFRSLDAGEHWARVDSLTPMGSVWDIEVMPGNSMIVYAAVSHVFDHSEEETYLGGVYKSTDGGTTWTNSSLGFGEPENLNITALDISPVNGNTIYAVTSDSPYHDLSSGRGIIKTTDAAQTWTPINDGLGVRYFDAITVDPSQPSVLYAGSGGNGLWKGIDNDQSGDPDGLIPTGLLKLPQNIPNPFNPRTTISYTLPRNQQVTLRVYNLQGRLVRTLFQGRQNEGSHTVTWNGWNDRGARVASGLYFYRLITDDGTLTRKMTLVQ